MARFGAYGPIRCGAYGRMRCIWLEAVHMVRCCSCTKKISRIINRCESCDAVHMVGCDAVHMVRCSMWETTFARNTQAGFCKEIYESNILFSIGYGRKVLTKSCLGITRKCCFPHGGCDAVLVCTKKINRITNRCDAVHMVGCNAVNVVRCDAVNVV